MGKGTWEEGPSPHESRFKVLAVCRANQCRSPLIEFVLREGAAHHGLPWVVSSAGTNSEAGAPMHPWVARMLAKQGIASGGWTSQRLTLELINSADLILTATEGQRLTIVELAPEVESLTFPLLNFARLTYFARRVRRTSATEFGPWLVQEVARQQRRIRPVARVGRDLADPIGRPLHDFKKCASLVEAACDEILARSPDLDW